MLGTVLALASLALGGFLLSPRAMGPGTTALAMLSPVRWACEALLDMEFHDVPLGVFAFTAHVAPNTPSADTPRVEVTGDEVLETFAFVPGTAGRNAVGLVALGAAFFGVAMWRLEARARRMYG